jgi:hypothetical protein
MINVASITMITLDELPHQVIKDVDVSFEFAAIVILISTLSIVYAASVLISIVSIVLILVIVYFTGWTIGCNDDFNRILILPCFSYPINDCIIA